MVNKISFYKITKQLLMYTVIKAFKITIRLNLETVYCDQRAGLVYLMGGPQVSLMV